PELSLRRSRFDLRATVTAALKEVAPVARRHKLVPPRAGHSIFVRGDRRRTAEVVAGLVHNATKYAPKGTRINVRIERGGTRAIVRVRDEGPGVPPPERARIFEAYARGAGDDDVARSGSGPFAARRVIEARRGDLWVEGAPERVDGDYLEKPFRRKELSSRVRALLRRAGPQIPAGQSAASIGGLKVDPRTHLASVDGTSLDLTPTEFRLLAALAARPGEVLERRALLRAGWPEERDPDPERLKAHLARLRSK